MRLVYTEVDTDSTKERKIFATSRRKISGQGATYRSRGLEVIVAPT